MRKPPLSEQQRERATRPRRTRPALAAAVGLAAVAALCAALLTTWSQDRPADDTTTQDAGGQGQTYAEGIACARLIAEGDVLDVRPASRPGRVLLRFAVNHWIKPDRGADTVELDLVDPSVAQVEEPFAKGRHLLLVVPAREDLEADASSGAELTRMREVVDANRAKAATTKCPRYWRETPG
ncbi:hypothetical protein [Streptomyces sp. NPDC101166]|uniref:hypothetical protein n=1 Tax=Streptomyces sp. NPDC101166 TaxID=3366120 RepID=UPI00381F51EB